MPNESRMTVWKFNLDNELNPNYDKDAFIKDYSKSYWEELRKEVLSKDKNYKIIYPETDENSIIVLSHGYTVEEIKSLLNIELRIIKGDKLDSYVIPRIQNKKERKELLDKIVEYNATKQKRILGLFGIRRTGKTTLLLQALNKLKKEEVAYLLMSKKTNISSLITYMDKEENKHINYWFLDEITYAQDFFDNADLLYKYVEEGKHVIIAGTDSYALNIIMDEILFGRMKLLHTANITFPIFNYILGLNFETYIKQGGLFDIDEFYTQEDVEKYIKESIVDNLIHTFEKMDKDTYKYPSLLALSTEDLYPTIEQVIKNENKEITNEILAMLYKPEELSLALKNLKKRDTDPLTYPELNKNEINRRFAEILKVDTKVDVDKLGKTLVEDIYSFLQDIDIIRVYYRYLNDTPIRTHLFNLPGLRYNHIIKLFSLLLADEAFNSLDEHRKNELLTNIDYTAQGFLMEHNIINYCTQIAEQRKFIKVTQLTYTESQELDENGKRISAKEYDMVIQNGSSFDIYEIKRDDEINEERQCRWLVDKELQEYAERLFKGKLRNRYVLYMGDPDEITYQGKSIKYLNSENFLKNLTPDNIWRNE